MAGFRIEGNTSGNVAEVDAGHNINVSLPQDLTYAGYTILAGELSEATDPAGLIRQDLRTSTQGRLTVGEPVPLLSESFSTTAINTAVYKQASTTQTITVGGGTLNLNASAINTLSTYCAVSTYAYFPMYADFATYGVFDMSFSVAPQVNNTVEVGFFQSATNAAPTDGAFFRFDTTGTLKAVLNNNGTEYTSSALTAPSNAVMHRYKIICENDRVLFYIDGACQAVIASPTGLGMPTYSAAQPFSVRNINAATAPALANQVKIGYIFVGLQDAVGMAKPLPHINANAGKMGYQGQSGHTMGSTALYTNSLAAGAGVAMTNTTAALGSGLGGQFSYLPTLAANTDGILCSFQNPAVTSAIPGKTLFITGVKITSMVTTALTGGPLYMTYSLAFGHTAVSLATTEGAGTKAPRRIALGFETFAATAAVGTIGAANPVSMQFASPIAVNPGEFVQVVAKNLGGTVTTAGVVTALVTFDAYWE